MKKIKILIGAGAILFLVFLFGIYIESKIEEGYHTLNRYLAKISYKDTRPTTYDRQPTKSDIEYYKKAIRNLPEPDLLAVEKNEFWFYHQLGFSLLDMGNEKESFENFEKALKVAKKEMAISYYHLGFVRLHQKRYPEAKKFFELAIEYNPDYYDAYQNKAVIYRLKGRYQDSVDACNVTISRFPDFAKAHCSKGWAYEKMGKYLEAAQAHLEAIRLAPNWNFPKMRILNCLTQINDK